MEGGLNNGIIYEEYSSSESRSDEKNTQILLLTASDEEEMDNRIDMSPRFTNNGFVLPDESYDMEGADIQYQYIDQDGILHQIQDISKTNLKLAQMNDSKIGWTKPMVKCLINCYRELILEFRDPSIKQKEVWSKAAAIMKERGYNLSWSHCDRKWRNLKHTFKKYYYGKKDNKKMSWEFYEDLLVLFAPDCRDEYKGKQRMSRIILPPANGEEPASSSTIIVSPLPSLPPPPLPPPPLMQPSLLQPPPLEHLPLEPPMLHLPPMSVHRQKKVLPKMDRLEPFNDKSLPPLWFSNYMADFEKRQHKRLEEIRTLYEHSLEVERQKCKMLEALLQKIANKCDL